MKELIKEETLDVIRQMVADGQISQEVAEKYFPKLKESEDEKIRKALIFHYQGDGCICTNEYRIDFKDIRAWLEKQCQQKTDDKVESKFKVGDIITPKDGGHEPWRIMQVDILDKKYRFKDGYVIHFSQEDNYELVKQETDKAEPKFKVEDWVFIEQIDNIINGPRKIKEVSDYGYVLDGIREIVLPFTSEHCMRLWTIEDAKPSDVLSYRDGQWIFIYKEIVTEDTFKYYALSSEKGITVNDAALILLTSCITPATKEQRDLLSQKMKEAGYTFDFEKKELKKIEQLADKTEPNFKFKVGQWIVATGKCIYCITKIDGFNVTLVDVDNNEYVFDVNSLNNARLLTIADSVDECIYEYEKGRADAIAEMQKHWSEEDDEMLDSIIEEVRYIGDFPDYPTKEENELYDECLAKVEWLKSLKDRVQPQSKQEWSEEDEKYLKYAIHSVEDMLGNNGKNTVTWLKSLRPQSRWKPSVFHLECISDSIAMYEKRGINAIGLKEILDELKKQREE